MPHSLAGSKTWNSYSVSSLVVSGTTVTTPQSSSDATLFEPSFVTMTHGRVLFASAPTAGSSPTSRISPLRIGHGLGSDSIADHHVPNLVFATLVPLCIGGAILLSKLGFYKGAADGKFGERTSDALQRWQRSKKLDEDGLPTRDNLEKLRKA